MDLYFQRHDGQAVTVDDFVQAMADAGGRDLGQFRLWYEQAGTPRLEASGSFDPAAGTYTLTVRQSCPPTPGQPEKKPFHIPLVMGLLDRDGRELPCTLAGENGDGPTTRILEIRDAEETFRFTGLAAQPVPALLRTFSAPVKLSYPYDHDDLVLLMAHEKRSLLPLGGGAAAGRSASSSTWWRIFRRGGNCCLDPGFVDAFRATLTGGEKDKAFLAEALTLPSEAYLAELMEVADPSAIHRARQFVRQGLAEQLRREFLAVREEL